MKKIYIECDTIIEIAEIKKILETMNYDGEKYIILNANLKGRLKDTLSPATEYGYGNIDNYKSVLGIDIFADTSKTF